MFNSQPVLDVLAHVSHPMGGMGMVYMFLNATNHAMESPIGTDAATRFGLDDEAFEVTVGRHVSYIDERNIDVQVIGPRPGQLFPSMLRSSGG